MTADEKDIMAYYFTLSKEELTQCVEDKKRYFKDNLDMAHTVYMNEPWPIPVGVEDGIDYRLTWEGKIVFYGFQDSTDLPDEIFLFAEETTEQAFRNLLWVIHPLETAFFPELNKKKVFLYDKAAKDGRTNIVDLLAPDNFMVVPMTAPMFWIYLKDRPVKGNIFRGKLKYFIDKELDEECLRILNGETELEEISVNEDNALYRSMDGVLFSKDGTKILVYPKAKKNAVYNIPAGVTTISENAFNGCSTLKELIIPDSVTSIGKNAFAGIFHITYHGNARCTRNDKNWGAESRN